MDINVKDYEVGCAVGRFQVAELHPLHIQLIEHILNNHAKALILVGIAPTLGTREDPLSFISRKQMIKEAFPPSKYPGLVIAVIKDIENDEAWSRDLDDAIRLVFPMKTALLYGGRDSFKQYYSGKFPHTNITDGVLSLDSESGTASRTKIAREDPVSSVDFRKGIIYSTQQQYPKVFPTVDAAIVCSRPSDKTMMILMGRKPGEESWRLPGGFVDPEDRSYEDACRRELIEETGYEVDKLKLHYLGSYRQNDWRYQKTDCITTTLFTSLVQFQSDEHLLSVKAGDDLKDLAWLPLARGDYKVNPVHAHLYEAVLDHYGME